MARSGPGSRWTGISRSHLFVLCAIAPLALIVLGLGISYGRTLARTPLEDHYARYFPHKRASTSSLVFYSGFLPLITILHACTDAALYFLSLLHPLYALVVSLIWFLGWAVQTAIWGICYGDGSYEQDVCPEWPLARRYKGGVPLARLAFAVLVTILYVGYVALAAAAVHRSRMASRRDGKQRATETGYVKEMGDM